MHAISSALIILTFEYWQYTTDMQTKYANIYVHFSVHTRHLRDFNHSN